MGLQPVKDTATDQNFRYLERLIRQAKVVEQVGNGSTTVNKTTIFRRNWVGNGLYWSGHRLSVLPAPDLGIVVSAAGVSAKLKASGGLAVDSNGLYALLKANSGIVVDVNGLYVLLKAGGGILVDATGLYLSMIPTVYVIGDILYADSISTLARLADVAVGSYLRSGGVGVAPLWSTLTLPNTATAFRLQVATAADTIGELGAVGATGEYLKGNTGAIPSWATTKFGTVYNVVTNVISNFIVSSNYYFGSKAGLEPQTTAAIAPLYITKDGVIDVAYIHWSDNVYGGGIAGSNEDISIYIRLNNTTDTLIATVGSVNSSKLFSNAALAISVSQGDYIEIKLVTPTWVTAPVDIAIGGVIHIKES